MPNNMLVKRIKTLQRAAGVDDESYRAMLSGYGVESCRDLDAVQAASVISFLQMLVDGSGRARPRRATAEKRYEELDGRSAEWATSKQLRMLEAMWMDVTRQKTREKALLAYHSWLLAKFEVTTPEMLSREDVGKVKAALAAMRKKAICLSNNREQEGEMESVQENVKSDVRIEIRPRNACPRCGSSRYRKTETPVIANRVIVECECPECGHRESRMEEWIA